jgi:hypothetical protein
LKTANRVLQNTERSDRLMIARQVLVSLADLPFFFRLDTQRLKALNRWPLPISGEDIEKTGEKMQGSE